MTDVMWRPPTLPPMPSRSPSTSDGATSTVAIGWWGRPYSHPSRRSSSVRSRMLLGRKLPPLRRRRPRYAQRPPPPPPPARPQRPDGVGGISLHWARWHRNGARAGHGGAGSQTAARRVALRYPARWAMRGVYGQNRAYSRPPTSRPPTEGGWLDGALGVCYALEAARAIQEAGGPSAVDVINFQVSKWT